MPKIKTLTVIVTKNKDLVNPIKDVPPAELVVVVNNVVYRKNGELLKDNRLMKVASTAFNIPAGIVDNPIGSPAPEFDGPHQILLNKYGLPLIAVYKIFYHSRTATQGTMCAVSGLTPTEIKKLRAEMFRYDMLSTYNTIQRRTDEWFEWLEYYFTIGDGAITELAEASQKPIVVEKQKPKTVKDMILEAGQDFYDDLPEGGLK